MSALIPVNIIILSWNAKVQNLLWQQCATSYRQQAKVILVDNNKKIFIELSYLIYTWLALLFLSSAWCEFYAEFGNGYHSTSWVGAMSLFKVKSVRGPSSFILYLVDIVVVMHLILIIKSSDNCLVISIFPYFHDSKQF